MCTVYGRFLELYSVTISGFDGVLAAAQEGSEWAWDIVVRDLAPSLVGFFRARGVPDPEALVGEVFVDLARNLDNFDGDADRFRSWVFVIAYRRMSDEWRRLRRRPEEIVLDPTTASSPAVPSAEDEALDALGEAEVAAMLQTLTEDQRDVIALRVVAGLSLHETAVSIGKPVSAVKALQRRGIAALRREIVQQGVSK
jgi:RNA polymerase sigma-70 factor (ECF subfamily)